MFYSFFLYLGFAGWGVLSLADFFFWQKQKDFSDFNWWFWTKGVDPQTKRQLNKTLYRAGRAATTAAGSWFHCYWRPESCQFSQQGVLLFAHTHIHPHTPSHTHTVLWWSACVRFHHRVHFLCRCLRGEEGDISVVLSDTRWQPPPPSCSGSANATHSGLPVMLPLFYRTFKHVHVVRADGPASYPASCPAHFLPRHVHPYPCTERSVEEGRVVTLGGGKSNSSNFPPCQQTPKTDGSWSRNPFSSTWMT